MTASGATAPAAFPRTAQDASREVSPQDPGGVVERALLFGLLADPLRLKIIELLAAEQLCTCHLIEQTGAKQTTVSHHLRLLREAGAVQTEQVGRFTWYRLRPHVLRLLAGSLEALAHQAEHAGRHRAACS
jgi:ArsR family transcriptional regulator